MSNSRRAKPAGFLIAATWGSGIILALSAVGLVLALVLGRPLPPQFALPAVGVHVGAALTAIALAIGQVSLPKGGVKHQIAGYVWCAIMAVVAVSSFAIQLEPESGVTLAHQVSSLFSIATLVLIPLVAHYGRRWKRGAHRKALLGIFGFIVVAGGLTFIPGRALGDLIAALPG